MAVNKYNSIRINSCRVCSSKNLRPILDLGPLFLSDFIKNRKSKTEKFPLNLVICSNCSLVQLKHTTPPSKLYTNRYGYKSGVNNTMRNELNNIAVKGIKISSLKKGDLAIDIGANDGTLLSFYPKNINKLAVEPIKILAKEARKTANLVLADYFSLKKIKKTFPSLAKAKLVTAIAMFYDLDNPVSFLIDIEKLLLDDGVLIIQQNYLPLMLKFNAFDNIVHEHLEYYSLLSLENALNKANLRVFDVEKSQINGGSFRTYICKNEAKFKESKNVLKMRSDEKKLKLNSRKIYIEFAKRAKEVKKKTVKYIKNEVSHNRSVYVYGASTRGNTLLQYFGLDNTLIEAAVERNPQKWGKFIASTGIKIISENEARKNPPDNMLVLPWFFKDEFLKRESEYLESGGTFIFPLPKFHLIKSQKN